MWLLVKASRPAGVLAPVEVPGSTTNSARTREFAVRRALGARAADVIRLIVGQGLRLVAIGLVLGLAGALAVSRLLTGLLYEISPWDIGTYLGTIAVLGGAAVLATLLPAIRAATVAPLVVLQQE